MPGGIAEQEHHRAVLRDDVEDIAAGLIRLAAPTRQIVLGQLRHRLGEDGDLDVARDAELVLDLLFRDQLLEKVHALDDDGATGRQRGRHLHIVVVEDAGSLVQHLQHAHEDVVVAKQRNRQDVFRRVAGGLVDRGVEARIGVGVRHVDDLAGPDALAGQPDVGGNAKLGGARRHPRGQDVRRGVVEKDGPTVSLENVDRGLDDLCEQRREIERPRQLARNL